ncbi:MAG: DUF5723 family protein [Saprospiraceae bacterium]
MLLPFSIPLPFKTYHAKAPPFLLFSYSCPSNLFAQQEMWLNQSTELWHANSTNPAFFPAEKNSVVGLPSFGLDGAHSGDVTYNDMIRKDGDKTYIDFSQLIDRLDPQNEAYYSHRFETVSFGFQLPMGLRLFAGHALRLNTDVAYPKSLPELLWNGNGPYVGQTLDIAPSAVVYDFNDLSAGLSFTFGKVSLGARMHYLSGISSLKSDPDHRTATVFTDPDIYQLTLETDYAFHSASIITGIDTSGLGFDLKTEVAKGKLFSQNSGSSFDFGVQVQVNDKLQVHASALDLGGKINWESNAAYFKSEGKFEYDGVVFPGTDLINNSDSIDFDAQLDTLNDIFKFVKTPESFSTSLPARFYAGAAYQLNDHWRFGLNVFHQSNEQNPITAVSVAARWAPLRWLSVGALYGVNQNSASNLGFQLGLYPGPVQIYILSDNLGSVFTPYGSSAVNFRGGLALVF